MDDEQANLIAGLIIGLIIGFIITLFIVFDPYRVRWETEAIEKGFAEHNQTTGDWQWKKIEKEEVE